MAFLKDMASGISAGTDAAAKGLSLVRRRNQSTQSIPNVSGGATSTQTVSTDPTSGDTTISGTGNYNKGGLVVTRHKSKCLTCIDHHKG